MTAASSVQLATDVAERKRDEAALELVQAQRTHRFAQDQLDQLDTYAAETIARWTVAAQVSATPELLRHHYQFMERLHHAIGLQRGVMVGESVQLELAGQVLLQADFRLAALKQVLRKKKADMMRLQIRREQKQMDEFAALQFARVVRNSTDETSRDRPSALSSTD
ncbi:flagellar export protein FliJ [Rhodoferax sp.]|uniref:flagellar export protein FliJ n=1 Tax=Rhodoferax sp. TaxID=50421 RepID=UPI00275DA925|nr:flagellar export protein FliJ [Rhodoferax sp.]